MYGALLVCWVALAGGAGAQPRALQTSPSANASATASPSGSPSPTGTATPSVTPTASLSPGASPSNTAAPTTTASPSPSPSVSPGSIFSEQGCVCTGPCSEFVVNSRQWCYTSEEGVDPPPTTGVIVLVPNADPSPGASTEERPCGFYSATSQRYWDFACNSNRTVDPARQLTTASEVWTTVTTSAVVAAVAVYTAFGIALSRRVMMIGAPVLALGTALGLIGYGALASFCIVAVVSVPLAQVYLAMPYAITHDTAVALGVSLGLIASYFHTGQHFESMRPFS